MVDLSGGYEGSSCVIKTVKNDLITLGVLRRIGNSYIDIGVTRNELPLIPYNLPVKVEVYNTKLGFRVVGGNVYLSTREVTRIVQLVEVTDDEKREFFRISCRDTAVIYNFQGEDYDDDGEKPDVNGIKVRLVDISLGGILFCGKDLFKVGDMFNIVFPAMGSSVLFACKVKRKEKREKDEFGYGCEFQNKASRQEDMLYRYILKLQNDQLRRMR